MTDRPSEKQVDALITAYLAGSLSDADRPAFEAWLRASPVNPRRVARLSATDFALREVCQDTKADYLLDILNQIDDASGPAKLVTLHHLKATRHPYRLYAIGGAVAAVLVLAITLTFVFSGTGKAPQVADIINTPSEPGPVGPTLNNVVATLTAEHDAIWAEGASAPGSLLRAGQRLTLTQGLAEITTNRGAIAILEAPATIQLLNDNALRLHAGKLVGLCHTESSKGFVVKTAHADIIDLGTEFGVEVNGNQVTTTVFTGQVELATPGSKPQPLTQNQTAQLRINGINRRLTVKDQLAQGFDKLQAMSPTAALRNDPAMIAYYGFEADDLVDGKLLNRAAATLGKMDGILGQAGRADSKPTLTQGRRPGTGALRFEAEEYDLVRIPATDAKAIDGLEQFTIGVWVKPDNMNQESHHLLTKRLSNQQSVVNFGLAWEIPPVGGYLSNTVFLNRHSMDSEATASFKADALKRDSRWMHIVVTFDHGERVLYKDGQLIERLPALGPDRDAALDAELLIGAASPHLDELGTYLDGDLDELFILGRVMSEQGVRAMYEAGVPGPPAETRGPAAPVP